MSDFMSPVFRQANITQQKIPAKIKVRKEDVNLTFILARPANNVYKIEYMVSVIPSSKELNQFEPLRFSTVDLPSLKDSIINNIDPYDRKYLVLDTFDTRKAVFHVNEKFFIDAFSNIQPSITISSFKKDFKLKVQLPKVIVYDPIKSFDSFLMKKFIEFIEKNRKEPVWFKHLIPKELRKNLRYKFRNMFDWEYDSSYNKITATLKTIYILAIIYATGSMLKKIKKHDIMIKQNDKKFSQKVKDNLVQFDSKKFDEYVRRKGFL
jgi:hypothetical protein